MSATIKIKERTSKTFDLKQLESFINSEDFEDIVLGYQMIKGETGKKISFSSFKNKIGS